MQAHSVFAPHSPQGHVVASLWWAMFGAGAAVWIAVTVLMLGAVLCRRRGAATGASRTADRRARTGFVVSLAITGSILGGFLVADFMTDYSLVVREPAALTIDVTGHQWWWQVDYQDSQPGVRVETANEIHVPVGRLVRVKLHSVDVIHSFWAPSLAGKRDLIPGYESSLWFRADSAGVYRGQCAEFCGMQHAKMAFLVIAQPEAVFNSWLAAVAAPNAPPSDSLASRGMQLVMNDGCAFCHAISGTTAHGTLGPSLSHLASRSTLAAGTLANTRANLAGWIANPAAIKPGTQMPAVPLSGDELTAVVAYLETLR